MNLHNLLAGKNITNGELEAQVSRIIGTTLLCSITLNAIFIVVELNRYEKKNLK